MVVSAEPFSHGPGTLRCLQKEMATYRYWSMSLWRDPDDVPHCWILSHDKTEWRLISATLCRWRRCFVADQLWLMTRIREEEDWQQKAKKCHWCSWSVSEFSDCFRETGTKTATAKKWCRWLFVVEGPQRGYESSLLWSSFPHLWLWSMDKGRHWCLFYKCSDCCGVETLVLVSRLSREDIKSAVLVIRLNIFVSSIILSFCNICISFVFTAGERDWKRLYSIFHEQWSHFPCSCSEVIVKTLLFHSTCVCMKNFLIPAVLAHLTEHSKLIFLFYVIIMC